MVYCLVFGWAVLFAIAIVILVGGWTKNLGVSLVIDRETDLSSDADESHLSDSRDAGEFKRTATFKILSRCLVRRILDRNINEANPTQPTSTDEGKND